MSYFGRKIASEGESFASCRLSMILLGIGSGETEGTRWCLYLFFLLEAL